MNEYLARLAERLERDWRITDPDREAQKPIPVMAVSPEPRRLKIARVD